MGMKKFLLFAIFLVSLSFLISNAKAVTYISGCSNLTQEGETYYLTQDIIDSSISPCISISANNITLDCQNHVIDGVGDEETYGIYVYNVQNVTIKNCLLTDWDFGLYLYNSNSSTLLNINSNSNSISIYLDSSSYNQIINSTNSVGNIYLDSSSYNQIINSTFNSTYAGITLHSSSYNQIINSTFNFNADGIFLSYSSNNQIINSTFNSNSIAGIYLNYGLNNTIYNNIIQNNTNGIRFYSSGPNKIYNNLFNNTNNFYFGIGTIYSNYWNTTKQLGQRIYSLGNYIGGNYWTNSTGNGYSDICADDDRDGFCDLPYDFLGDGTNVDYLPLSNKYAPPNLPPEIIIFSPLNRSYYGSIDFAFKATDDFDENFTVRTYLNNQLEYENLYYQNDTQISYSKSLPMGTYNFTVYAEDSYGASSQQEVFFTSLGYCGDNICQADYENNMNCFKDCGGTARQFTVGIGSVVLAFGGLMLLATAFASSPTEGKDYVFKIFIAVIGIILMVYGIIYLINL
jgi:parallel beta-helix repeat protein